MAHVDLMLTTGRRCAVPNFRRAAGNVYRSAAPDGLAEHLDSGITFLYDEERFVLNDVTLIIDLRSESETDSAKRRAISQGAPGGGFVEVFSLDELMAKRDCKRHIFVSAHFAPSKQVYLEYVMTNWISKEEVETAKQNADEQAKALYRAINLHGLLGFVQVVLETKVFIVNVLKAMTIHLELNPDGKVLLHCSLGKDRCGMLSMLCQYMLGATDEEIIQDFARSSSVRRLAEEHLYKVFKDKVDIDSFANASPQTMMGALTYLRTKYGSVENYLDAAGFDEHWRRRFIAVAST